MGPSAEEITFDCAQCMFLFQHEIELKKRTQENIFYAQITADCDTGHTWKQHRYVATRHLLDAIAAR